MFYCTLVSSLLLVMGRKLFYEPLFSLFYNNFDYTKRIVVQKNISFKSKLKSRETPPTIQSKLNSRYVIFRDS